MVGSKLEGVDAGTGRGRSKGALSVVIKGTVEDEPSFLSSFDDPCPTDDDPATPYPYVEEDARLS